MIPDLFQNALLIAQDEWELWIRKDADEEVVTHFRALHKNLPPARIVKLRKTSV